MREARDNIHMQRDSFSGERSVMDWVRQQHTGSMGLCYSTECTIRGFGFSCPWLVLLLVTTPDWGLGAETRRPGGMHCRMCLREKGIGVHHRRRRHYRHTHQRGSPDRLRMADPCFLFPFIRCFYLFELWFERACDQNWSVGSLAGLNPAVERLLCLRVCRLGRGFWTRSWKRQKGSESQPVFFGTCGLQRTKRCPG